MKIKSWPKLLLSILVVQSAGLVGSLFTFSAIPTWYAYLNKPSFSPPNWVFGPVWTTLYTMIGISFYLILIRTNKKNSWAIKLFGLHLILNALWSIIFFGAKNLGLAFAEIVILWLSIIYMIKNYCKISRWSSYLLIPYLMWVSFASVLNFAIWKLNPQNTVKNIFAQDFTFNRAREDYIFTEDNYKKDLADFNLKRDSYKQNQTLSLKEEFRLSALKFVASRNSYVKNYLTMLRLKVVESNGIDNSKKEDLYSKLDPEVTWFNSRKDNYSNSDSLEDILNKTKEEDSRYKDNTLPIIDTTLAYISLGSVREIKDSHIKIYENQKKESESLVSLGRADKGLFDRWFKDINSTLDDISKTESATATEIDKILGADEYLRSSAYKKSLEVLEPSKQYLVKLNNYVQELENVLEDKR
jgi:tryptophan-rich sensory protein